MAELTFRDFAGAAMSGDRATAASVLEQLLGVPPATAEAATGVFLGKMSDPGFMAKAMGLRNAVTTGTDEEISTLVEACFGLHGPALEAAVVALRARYPH